MVFQFSLDYDGRRNDNPLSHYMEVTGFGIQMAFRFSFCDSIALYIASIFGFGTNTPILLLMEIY